MKRQANKFDIQELYLDWVNNFLTAARFAEYYNITEAQALALIELGRSIHEDIAAEYKLEKEG